MARLRARLTRLETALADAGRTLPPPPAPVVLVGAGGSGKTSLALKLALAPAALGAASAAVLVVAPEADALWTDPSPLFWTLGVPAVVVRTADDVRAALDTLAGADLIVVDTPALPLAPEAARAAAARLGGLLAPLAAVDVHLVVDAARAPVTLPDVAELGLRPDALALTRLDEAPPRAAAVWAAHVALPVRLTSGGSAATDFAVADPSAGFALPPVEARPPARAASLADTVRTSLTDAACAAASPR